MSYKDVKYNPIYVHSKLMRVDDVFFTLGSANVNARSMESDSELHISSPSLDLTRQWREHLWKIHSGVAPLEDFQGELTAGTRFSQRIRTPTKRKMPC